MQIYRGIDELIGHTPLLRLSRMNGAKNASVLVKLESRNPGGSIKDRVAAEMIADAERTGKLKPHGTIVEPTSGNTGIGLAVLCAVKGYNLVIVMPDSMSKERMALMTHFGAELVLTPGAEGMAGALRRADELVRSRHAILAGQFDNPANPLAHEKTTGEEIWADTGGKIDAFVAAVGTGGTFTGTVRALRKHNPKLFAAAVEPASSPLISAGKAGPHRIQGIGANFIPKNFDRSLADEIITVTDSDAIETAKQLSLREGVLCGISAGANVFAALELAKRPQFRGRMIATVICDTGERYLSTELFK